MASPEIPQGRPGNLSDAQQSCLEDLKRTLIADSIYDEGSMPPDIYLCRFARARDWNLKKTVTMLKNDKKWRAEVGVDHLWDTWDMSKEEKAKIVEAWPQYFHGMDNEGRPLYIQRSKLSPKELFEAASEQRLFENFVIDFFGVIQTRYPACSEATGKYIDESFLLMDSAFYLSPFRYLSVRALFQKTIAMSQDYFPETSGKIRIINNGAVFQIAYNVLRPFIAPKTVEKIEFLGYDYKEKLLKEVDADQLPEQYGGTCKCEGGCQNSNKGPWGAVPPKKDQAEPNGISKPEVNGSTETNGMTVNGTTDVETKETS